MASSIDTRIPPGAGVSGGKILPNNAFDLMKHIRENESKGNTSLRSQVHANRLLKQELQREMIERKLMEVEDYTYTLEGKRRERAYEDRLHMYVIQIILTHNFLGRLKICFLHKSKRAFEIIKS